MLYSKLSTKCCDAIACGLPDVRRTLCLLDCSQEEEPLLSLSVSSSVSSFQLVTSVQCQRLESVAVAVAGPTSWVLLPQDLLQREVPGALIVNYGTALQVARAARTPSQTYIASPAASWLDDFLSWISPEIPRCCR